MFQSKKSSLDDLMRSVFVKLLSGEGLYRVEARKGSSTEAFGTLLELTNPRSRLSRSAGRARVFSALGELTWNLSGSSSIDHIQYYISEYSKFSDDETSANGAYGPRIFGAEFRGKRQDMDGSQWHRVMTLLKERPGTRNAVIQIFSNDDDCRETKDVPCTCTIQFAIRQGQLQLHTHMRSNDAYWGLPHDFFSFTMIQEIAARELGVELGTYIHSVGSLHLYDDSKERKSVTGAREYLAEGFHEPLAMPPMPSGDPWPAIEELLDAEQELRAGNLNYQPPEGLHPYWQDLTILLKAYACIKHLPRASRDQAIEELVRQLHEKSLRLYLLDKIDTRLLEADGVLGEMD